MMDNDPNGFICLLGRVHSVNVRAYALKVRHDGYWGIYMYDGVDDEVGCTFKYFSPFVYSNAGNMLQHGYILDWHEYKLSFRGNTITAFADGKQLGDPYTDAKNMYPAGTAGFGCSYNRVLFDKFSVI